MKILWEWEPYWHLLEGEADVLNSWTQGQGPGVLKLCLQEEGMVQKVGHSLWVGLVSGPTGCGDRNWTVFGEG